MSESASEAESVVSRNLPKQDYSQTDSIQKDIKSLLAYIDAFKPDSIPLDYHLEPFLPDYIPCIGDIDPVIQVF